MTKIRAEKVAAGELETQPEMEEAPEKDEKEPVKAEQDS